MKQESAKPEHSFPDLLKGSEYKAVDPDSERAANLLGLAIAIVVHAEKDNVKKDVGEKWLRAFEAEREQVRHFRQNEDRFYQQHPIHSGQRNPPADDPLNFYWNRIQQWLKEALFVAINWHELYELIKIQPLIFRKGGTKWWDEVKSVCVRVATTTDTTFDPINEIKRISEKHSKAQEQVKKPAETEQKAAINVHISGDVKAEKIQIGHDATIQEQTITEEKKKGIIWKVLKVIVKIIGAIVIGIIVAVVINILGDFGWIGKIKIIIYNIFTSK
jgi:uncharacterized membrane protein YraQ (UPF0718 family)